MKTIGLIGGMSYESSLKYYRIINELVNKKLQGYHSAKSLMYSVDFHEIEKLQREDKFSEAGVILADAARSIERGGADFLVLCTNTMHKVANQIEAAVAIPLIHIADATAEVISERGIKKVGLIGTRFTMEEDFYKKRLIDNYNLEVIVPENTDIEIVDKIIFDELVFGNIREESKEVYLKVMDKLIKLGAEGIILGCTEIGLLIKQEDTPVILFDTTYIHAQKAVENALS